MKNIILAFILLSVASGAHADGMRGKMLLDYCQSLIGAFKKDENIPLTENELSSSGLCSGFIEGTLSGSYFMRSLANDRYKSINTTNKLLITDYWDTEIGNTIEIAIVVVNYLKRHPEEHNKPAVSAIYYALREKYPVK